MTKFFAVISVFFVLVFVIFFKTSSLNDHALFFIKNQNIYETFKSDGSFGDSPAFFIIEKIPFLKNKIHTGEYIINEGESALSVIKKMILGDKVTRKITFPEGLTTQMIIENLNQNDLLFEHINELPPEASLMPDTYFYQFGDTKQSVILKMKNNMKKTISTLSAQNKTKLTMTDIITLASIIEKETAIESERSIISSVFHNRLSKKMRLQSCPTVIYAITNGYGKMDRKLTKNDLFFQSSYNTYRVSGLPPTPICCPGKKSIEAAMNPSQTDFLYFVADSTETYHQFSKNYDNHKKNIASRKIMVNSLTSKKG